MKAWYNINIIDTLNECLVLHVNATKGLYDLLFELSNETRHNILLLLQMKAMRITDITKELRELVHSSNQKARKEVEE